MSRNGTFKPKLIKCNFDINEDFARTVQDAAITPRQIAELTARGIPISPQNIEREVQGNNSWHIDPVFRRQTDMATAWEMEQNAKARARFALQRQKHSDFMKKLEN